jgi:hypothetical protein
LQLSKPLTKIKIAKEKINHFINQHMKLIDIREMPVRSLTELSGIEA